MLLHSYQTFFNIYVKEISEISLKSQLLKCSILVDKLIIALRVTKKKKKYVKTTRGKKWSKNY